MLRKLLALIAAALLLQPGVADARGGHGGGHSTSHSTRSSSSHATSTRSTSKHTTSHRRRSSGTHSSSHRTRSHDTRTHHSTKTRRDPAQRRAFQHSQPCPANGHTSGACPGYVVDHVIPLKRGGPDRPSNMQWQTTAEAKAKDKWE